MKKIGMTLATVLFGSAMLAAAPAKAADLCLQFDGASCDLSGDLGYFHFTAAKLPKTAKKAVALHGRACGGGVVYGTAVMTTGQDMIEIGGTFNCDAVNGTIMAWMNVSDGTGVGPFKHGGYAGYGNFDLNNACDVTVVDCALRPDL